MGIESEGYVVYRNLFSCYEIESITQEIYSLFEVHSNNGFTGSLAIIEIFQRDFDLFHHLAKQSQSLFSINRLSLSPTMEKILNKLGLKNPIINTKPLVSYSCISTASNDFYWKVPQHQDFESTKGSKNGVTCWMPLVNVTKELGPLEIYPKSHKKGHLPHNSRFELTDKFNDSCFESLPLYIGDALFFSYFTVHRSGVNIKTDEIRLSMHFRYDDLENYELL